MGKDTFLGYNRVAEISLLPDYSVGTGSILPYDLNRDGHDDILTVTLWPGGRRHQRHTEHADRLRRLANPELRTHKQA